MEASAVTPSRFERAEISQAKATSKILDRFPLHGRTSIGNFVSRIWALYGPPDQVLFEGFMYVFRDSETGLIFTAYSAGSGPAYGGLPADREKLLPVIDAFDLLLERTMPADCQIEFETDFGVFRSGARNGILFDEPVGQEESEK